MKIRINIHLSKSGIPPKEKPHVIYQSIAKEKIETNIRKIKQQTKASKPCNKAFIINTLYPPDTLKRTAHIGLLKELYQLS